MEQGRYAVQAEEGAQAVSDGNATCDRCGGPFAEDDGVIDDDSATCGECVAEEESQARIE